MSDKFELAENVSPFPSTVRPVDDVNGVGGGMGFSLGAIVLGQNNDGLPAYWSPERDKYLRRFVVGSDPLKIAVSTFINKLISVPVSITPKDTTIERHAKLAAELHANLMNLSGFMRGFREELKKIARDYLETDNGCFALIMGRGPANRPIVGPAMGIIHLDSERCTRTGDPEFPVVYVHTDNKRYALHYSRVIVMSNMPAAALEMYGVGLCAVSCAIESSRELKDMAVYSAEKMGSRPPRQILFARTGATITELSSAIQVFEQKLNSEGLDRFAKTLLLAPKNANMNLALDKIDLSSTPDGFDRERVSVLDLSLLAAAFGLDLHDLSLAFGMKTGGTAGNAEIQAKKGRGKGVHEFIETFTDQFQRRFLPDFLTFSFDQTDDDADEQRSKISDILSQARERDLKGGVTTLRIERISMLKRGDMSAEDFEMSELADGRTPDGLDILFLFHSEDPILAQYLSDFSVPDPTDVITNQAAVVVPELRDRQVDVYQALEKATNAKQASKLRQALFALQKLEAIYLEAPPPGMEMNDAVGIEAMDEGADATALAAEGEQPVEEEVTEEVVAEDKEAGRYEKQEAPFPIDFSNLSASDRRLVEEATQRYDSDFRELVQRAESDQISEDDFVRGISELTAAILLWLFLRGSRLTVGGMTPAEAEVIRAQIEIARASAETFGRALYRGGPATAPLSLGQALARAGIWFNMALFAFTLGQVNRRDNPRFRWRYAPEKVHCKDCLRLNGQVHTARQWAASGWYPRARHLTCTGFLCGCYLEETKDGERGNF